MHLYKKLLLGFSSLLIIAFFSYVYITTTTNSRASINNTVSVGFSEKQIQVQPDGSIKLDILINTQVTISQATISISYPRGMYALKKDTMDAISPECANNLIFPIVKNVQSNDDLGKVTITRSVAANNDKTPGAYCFGTLHFQLIGNMQDVVQSPFKIETSPDTTFAVDVKGKYVALIAIENARQANVLGMEIPPCMPTMDDTNCDGMHNEADIKSPGEIMFGRGL